MLSRLDRLFLLLDTGSSAVTRKAAAIQIGEVQRLHPHELHNLLKNVLKYVKSLNWETRIAAGFAVEAILKNVPDWKPGYSLRDDNDDININLDGKLQCKTFNIDNIVANSAPLMGSEGKEYDAQDILSVNDTFNLEKQQQQIKTELGLDTAAKFGLNTDNLFDLDDLKVEITVSESESNQKLNVGEVVGLSCREVNRAKRKARQALMRQKSLQQKLKEDDLETKKIKLDLGSSQIMPQIYTNLDDFPTPDNTGCWPTEAVEWPLEWFCSQLCNDIFSPKWEIRHGAATALRHFIKSQGHCGGFSSDIPISTANYYHQRWLEDVSLRLVCVLILDRFGDFNNDQVVAPVRETCAQALGVVVNLLSIEKISDVINVLLKLMDLKDWEARHGGLLGIKYIFAVRKDVLPIVLSKTYPVLHKALSDVVDDVAAVAAGALTLCVDLLTIHHPHSAIEIFYSLCSLIPDLDDLTPAANTFVPLISRLLLKNEINKNLRSDDTISDLVRRIWSLMSHNNSSVRNAALQTLTALPSTISSLETNEKGFPVLLLQPTLRHIFQRVILEHQKFIHDNILSVWCKVIDSSQLCEILLSSCPFITNWFCLTMQSTKVPFDRSLLIQVAPLYGKDKNTKQSDVKNDLKDYIGGNETIPQDIRESNSLHIRFVAAKMLGYLSTYIVQPAPGVNYALETEKPTDSYVKVLLVYLSNKSALQRFVAGLVIAEWSKIELPNVSPILLVNKLMECLTESVYYDEIGSSYTKLLQETRDFLSLLKHYKIPSIETLVLPQVLTLEQMLNMCGGKCLELITASKFRPKIQETLLDRRRNLFNSLEATLAEQNRLSIMTQASIAGALIRLKYFPDKLNPIIKPVMDSIKKEENKELQELSAINLTEIISNSLIRGVSPNNRIIANLCNYLKVDPEGILKVPNSDEILHLTNDTHQMFSDHELCKGIITLINQQKSAERIILKRGLNGGRGPGRPPNSDIVLEEIQLVDDQVINTARIQQRGCSFALLSIVSYFGEDLPEKLPILWKAIIGSLKETIHLNKKALTINLSIAEDLIGNLLVLEIVGPALHKSLLDKILEDSLPRLEILLKHPYSALRHMAARCIGIFAKLSPIKTLEAVISHVLPLMGATDNSIKRKGGVETVAQIQNTMQLSIIPFISFFIIPLLGCMSDQEECIRILATHTFANLIQLMPLDDGLSIQVELSQQLLEIKNTQKGFLESLFNPTTIINCTVPVPIKAELRPYQQAGINWLFFLNRYKLHGILCDDMGLGKTLQSICILAGDHYIRDMKYKETKQDDCITLPSLVICPPTLTGHWVFEVEKFVEKKYLHPLHYAGPPVERERLRRKVLNYNLIVASYDIVRKDIEFFSSIKWNYCILDEGHVIKNGKTKSTKAIKTIIANHRLILSGTPIQNNVLELWSLFDFLMPGFLGTEKQFMARYSKPILASRDPKSTSKEQEAGVLAMESLHRQVLPFVLRRMKEDVLNDLPPKITQDYYCELSPLQQKLYEDFSKSQARQSLNESIDTTQPGNPTHIFQALRYLQSVCSHPKLALTSKHPQFEKIQEDLKCQNTSLSDIQHAAKLPALKQLLNECGIGVENLAEHDDYLYVNQHRALIFCQLKSMLDILEKDFFNTHMPKVSYLRLDGSVPPNTRNHVVTTFNNDPSIDVLLLTTQVGGLGLNLTGADTVIFVEHDWSPMKDLQAMDRAHRIGQKKVVNVYRLITKGTLEEKIMGLQKFKLMTANTVISSENKSLETMGTEKLLDLFTLNNDSSKSVNNDEKTGHSRNLKSFLDSLPDLCNQKEYEDEYNIDNFLHKLKC